MFNLFGKRLSEPQKWALAAGGVLTERNGDPFDRMAVSYNRATSRAVLADAWGVEDRTPLLEQLDWLKEQGSRAELRAELSKIAPLVGDRENRARVELSKQEEFALKHFQTLKKTSFEAWDGSRLIMVARWGVASEYIEEREAWSFIMGAAKSMRLRLSSWKDVGDDFLLGCRYWSVDQVQDPEMVEAYTTLTTDSRSPWQSIPWAIDPELLKA